MGAILSRFNCLKATNADDPSKKPKAAPDREDDIDDQPTPRSAPAVKHAKSEPAPQTTAHEPKDASQQPAPVPTPPTGVLAPPEAEQSGVASDTAHAETGLAQPQRKDTIEIIIDDDEIPGTRAPTNQPIHAGPRQPGGPPPRPPPQQPRPPRSG